MISPFAYLPFILYLMIFHRDVAIHRFYQDGSLPAILSHLSINMMHLWICFYNFVQIVWSAQNFYQDMTKKSFFPIYCSPAIFKLKIRIFGQVSVKAVVCFRIKNFTFRWFPLKYGNMTICNMVPSVILNFQILLFLSYDHHCGLVLHLRKKNFIQIVQLAADLWVSCKLLGNGN